MLSLSSEDYFLEEADSHIQANLEDSVVQEALRSGVDLREYSAQVENELRDVENKSIQDYIRESQNIASLHNQIVNCDQILERMENMLLTFQSDLSSISTEILALQQQSVQMNVKLQNRQAVRAELSQFVNDMVVNENMISTILEAPVTEPAFSEELMNLEQKITFLKEQSFREARSCNDVRDVVEKLKIKAVAKIREYLLERINLFKKPLTNYYIPQNAMVKHKFYYKFLMANNREVAREIRDEYVETMNKVLFSYFKAYSSRLAKLQFEEVATREDLMGLDDSVSMARAGGVTSLFGGKSAVKSKASVFTMGHRGQILEEEFLLAPIIVPHAQQQSESKYPFEKLFRSEQFGLMENAVREYAFVVEFYMVSGNEAQEFFEQITGTSLSLLLKNLDQSIQESYDSISLYLCIQLVHKYRAICHSKSVLALEKYWDSVLGLLWARLKHVLRLNIQSVKECDPTKVKVIDQRPHYITRRYAEFSAGILSISQAEQPPNEGVASSPSNSHAISATSDEAMASLMADLQQEVEHFILKMTSVIQGRKSQLIFLINNYDMILSILSEHSRSNSKESDCFKDLLATRSAEYVDQVLFPHFGNLIKFIQRAELLLSSGDEQALEQEGQAVSTLIVNFNRGWKGSLDEINKEVLSSFPNFKNGTAILQQSLTCFVQYYHRFHKVLQHRSMASLPDKGQLINVHQLMVEVKKYKPNF